MVDKHAEGGRPMELAGTDMAGLIGVPCPDPYASVLNGKARITLPGTGHVVTVDADDVKRAVDGDGRPVPGQVSVAMDPDRIYPVVYRDSGGFVDMTRMGGKDLMRLWDDARGEIRLEGVYGSMVRETAVGLGDGSGRHMLQVAMPDPEAKPARGRTFGYGSFLVHPDSVRPSGTDPSRLDIDLGRGTEPVKGYRVFTGEYGRDGKGVYAEACRTAGEVSYNYRSYLASLGRSRAMEPDGKGLPEADGEEYGG